MRHMSFASNVSENAEHPLVKFYIYETKAVSDAGEEGASGLSSFNVNL